MRDPRWIDLGEVLVDYSVRVQEGDKVLIEAVDAPPEFVSVLIDLITDRNGVPLVTLKSGTVLRSLIRRADEEQMRLIGQVERFRMERMDAYIGVRGGWNSSEWSDIPTERLKLYQTHWMKPVHFEVRVPRTRWVVLRWPTPSMAQQAEMSTEGFEDFYFRVCCLDYERMARAMQPLCERLRGTSEVRLLGPGTDLTFALGDVPVIPCAGEYNIPDGEVFTAPIRESVQGVIQFNTPTLYHGTTFDRVRLEFRDGKIVDATSAQNSAQLENILSSDEGARYVGEFAIGLNPYITRPMKDILFDEKIAGSIHLTPGNAYEEADNGNRSEIHWDLVLLQDESHGGGEMQFDGVTVRRDGRFVLPELAPLNPEQLVVSGQ